MRSKFKKMLAVLASVSMCSSMLLQFPSGTFNLTLPVSAAEGDVQINETNFPDDVFRSYVDENFDTTNDNILTADEIAAATKIDFWSADITTVADLTGVQYFTALESLDCSSNQLTSLDVSKNTALERVYCYRNQLESLDISDCTALDWLLCNDNQLTSLDVSNCSALEYLYCYNNPLLSLKGVSNSVTTFNGSPLDAFLTTDDSVSLSEYGIVEANVSDLTGGEIKDGAIVPTTFPGTVTYTYDAGSDKTISCTIKFGIAINEENFPDWSFRTIVDNNYDTTDDNVLDAEEIAAVTKIDVSDNYISISNLTGIGYFTALTELNCAYSNLTSLDVSKNTALTTLVCYYNALTSLDVSNCAALTELNCNGNQLTNLDVSKNTALIELNCNDNQLTSLDVSNCAALEELLCYDNQLTSLDVSNCTALTELYCYSNQLQSLDVSNNTALTDLSCIYNQLTSLDVSNCTALTDLCCYSNQLQSLDVSDCEALTYLDCSYNQLTSLDVSNCAALEYLYCQSNQLWKLDLPANYSGALKFDTERTIAVANETIDLSAYELDAANFSGGTLDENGILTPDTHPGIVTYTYDVDGENTISCTIEFGIPINEETFPDDAFRAYVNERFDTTDNDILSTAEIAAATYISISNMGISDLTGIEYLTELTTLYCDKNALTSLDISKNTKLKVIDCSDNQLTSLDTSNNTSLTKLNCDANKITSLDLSKNKELYYLSCENNQLSELNVSNNTALTNLYCDNNQIASLDLSKNPELTYLTCSSNKLTGLDLSNNPKLNYLECHTNQIASLDVSNCAVLNTLLCDTNQLWKLDLPANYSGALKFDTERTIAVANETLDLSAYELDAANFSGGTLDENGILTPDTHPGTVTYTYDVDGENTISCTIKFGIPINETNFPDDVFREYVDDNFDTTDDDFLDAEEIAEATEINVVEMGISDLTGVEYFTALTDLYCDKNQLTSLDVSKNTALKYLYCNSNQLTSLDVSGCTALEYLICPNNQLTSLDVSKNTALTYLFCPNNQLTSLDVSQNTALEYLDCQSNQLTSLDVRQNTALETLYCQSNQLTSLDLSQNAALETLYCYSNSYEIDLIGGKFDLSALPEGFDVTKASEWTNAAVEDGVLTVSDPMDNITYIYDLGNGSAETFTLIPVSCTITEDLIVPVEDQTYTGSEIEPVVVKIGDTELVEDIDYTISYENNVDVGTASAVIKSTGDFYNGEVTLEFTILPEDVENLGMCLTNSLTYNGEEQTQLVSVTFAGRELEEGVDYTITGNTGTNAGDYTLTITGIGNFTGTYEATWSIDKAIPEANHFTFTPPADLVYDGTPKEATVTTDAIGMGEFTVKYADAGGNPIDYIPTDAGLYKVYIKAEEGDNYRSADEIWEHWEFIIEKAPAPEIITPTASEITYGQKLSDSKLSDSKWVWSNSDMVPDVINDGYEAYMVIEDSLNYDYSDVEGYGSNEESDIIQRSIPVTVKKAVPEVTIVLPEIEYTEGDLTPEIAFTSVIEGTIEWLTELKKLIAGENELTWQFTPGDGFNYAAVTGTVVIEAKATTTTTTTTKPTTTTTSKTTTSTTKPTTTTTSKTTTSTTKPTTTTTSKTTTSTTKPTTTTTSKTTTSTIKPTTTTTSKTTTSTTKPTTTTTSKTTTSTTKPTTTTTSKTTTSTTKPTTTTTSKTTTSTTKPTTTTTSKTTTSTTKPTTTTTSKTTTSTTKPTTTTTSKTTTSTTKPTTTTTSKTTTSTTKPTTTTTSKTTTSTTKPTTTTTSKTTTSTTKPTTTTTSKTTTSTTKPTTTTTTQTTTTTTEPTTTTTTQTTTTTTEPTTTTTTQTTTTTTEPIPTGLLGDVDRDGDVDITDAAEVLRYYAESGASLDPIFGKTEEEHEIIFPYADIDADGRITIRDASLILSYYAHNGAGLKPVWKDLIASH